MSFETKYVYEDNKTGTLLQMYSSGQMKTDSLSYGQWLIENCIITREGFRCWLVDEYRTEISNERAYELYLDSLKLQK
jgi:hypothetical protein